MPTPKAQALAEKIHEIFITTRDFDKGMYDIATLIDQHVLLEQARIARLEQAIGNMYDSQHDTPYGQE